MLGDLMWVAAGEFTGQRSGRSVDPAPLSRLIAAALGISGDLGEEMEALANDNDDGPIHIVHLLAACEYAARTTGGHVSPASGGDNVTQLLMMTTSVGQRLPQVAKAMQDGGFPAATAVVRAMIPAERNHLLDILLHILSAPILGLCTDLTEHQVRG